jgi:murein DD-endopeptidase MepM/ murein hydrolase activator NlpD
MFAYDFLLPTGTPIVAVRGGEVAWAYDSYPDGPGEYGNSVVIDHGDGTYAGYGHLTSGEALVAQDQQVAQGERVALSGLSGTDTAHLHLHVSPCLDVDEGACRSRGACSWGSPTRPSPTDR